MTPWEGQPCRSASSSPFEVNIIILDSSNSLTLGSQKHGLIEIEKDTLPHRPREGGVERLGLAKTRRISGGLYDHCQAGLELQNYKPINHSSTAEGDSGEVRQLKPV